MMSKRIVAGLLAVSLLTACESPSPSPQDTAVATGAVLGGVVGRQVGYASGAGAAGGAFLGSRVGASMDRNDQLTTAQALESAKDREVTTWRNHDARQRYYVIPTRTYSGPSGPCREFTAMAQLEDGRHLIAHGKACRQPDGSWKAA